jgi:hypothetical protein
MVVLLICAADTSCDGCFSAASATSADLLGRALAAGGLLISTAGRKRMGQDP